MARVRHYELQLLPGNVNDPDDPDDEDWVRFAAVQGEPNVRREITPPDGAGIKRVRDVWEVRGKLVSEDRESFEALASLLTNLDPSSAAYPVKARVIRIVPDDDPVEILKIPGADRIFAIELLDATPDRDVPAETGNRSFPLLIRLTGTTADPTSGIAAGIVPGTWDQVQSYVAGPNSLRTVEWDSTFETSGGVDAEDVARSLAALDQTVLGPTYAWDTNDTTGFDLYVLKRNMTTGIATKVRAVSRMKQFDGLGAAVVGPGKGPGDFSLTRETTTSPESEEVVTEAFASGLQGEQWVRLQAPKGGFTHSVIFEDLLFRGYRGRWTLSRPPITFPGSGKWKIKVAISGGQRVLEHRSIADDEAPSVSEGAFAPWQAIVKLEKTREGTTGKLSEFKLPKKLAEPWDLITEESDEGEPELVSEGNGTLAIATYKREATLVYRSPTPPKKTVTAELREQDEAVESYYYGATGPGGG